MASTPEERLSKLFVGGLNHDTTKESLKSYFEQFGEIKDCAVSHDPNTKKPRGFGFVTFKDHDTALEVLRVKNEKGGHVIDSKQCEVKRAIPLELKSDFSHDKTNKIFIGGLHEDATQKDIENMLIEKLGHPPTSISLMMRKDDHKKNRGYCFIELPNNDDADTMFCIKNVDIRGKMAEIKKSDPNGRGGKGGAGRGAGGAAAAHPAAAAAGYPGYPNQFPGAPPFGGYPGYSPYGFGYDPYAAGYAPYPGFAGPNGYSGMGMYHNQSASSFGPSAKGGAAGTGRGYRPY